MISADPFGVAAGHDEHVRGHVGPDPECGDKIGNQLAGQLGLLDPAVLEPTG